MDLLEGLVLLWGLAAIVCLVVALYHQMMARRHRSEVDKRPGDIFTREELYDPEGRTHVRLSVRYVAAFVFLCAAPFLVAPFLFEEVPAATVVVPALGIAFASALLFYGGR